MSKKKIVAPKIATKRTRKKKEEVHVPDPNKIQPPSIPKEKVLSDDQLKVTCKCMALDSLKTIDMIKGNAFFTVEKEGAQISIGYSRYSGKVEVGHYGNTPKAVVKKKLFSFKEFEDIVKELVK